MATKHRYFESHYWIPCIDSLKQRQKWKITILTHKKYQVACSGTAEKVLEIENSDDLGYTYRVDHPTSANKIGFFVGSKFKEHENRYFSNGKKLEDFRKYFINEKRIIKEITELFEQILERDFPYSNIDLVFVPNMFVGQKVKRRAL